MAWNSSTNEFGLINTGFNGSGAYVQFRSIRASDRGVVGRDTFGFAIGTYATGIAVNASSQYVLTWSLHPGTMSALYSASGSSLGTNLVSSSMGFDLSLGMAFNATSGTSIVVANDFSIEVAAAELYASGVPKTSPQVMTDGATIGSYYPLTDNRTGASQWDIVYSRDFKGAVSQVVASGSTGGDPAPTPPPPSPTPTPSPSTCTTSDPFAALGGGTCCNGGWLPPGMSCSSTPSPTPTPTPPPSTCSTPNPFSSLGGGTCCNGGWLPPGMTCSSQPIVIVSPSPSTCTTPDPFSSLGGGTCCNGGWLPPGMSCRLP